MSQNGRLVDVNNLHVYFPVFGGVFSKKVNSVKAVDGISFSIAKNQTIGLVGESGCGKTTVGRAMINILHHVAPDVEISGNINYHFENEVVDFIKLNPKKMQKYRSKVQMIFQDPFASLNPRMTVSQIISEPLQIHTKMSTSEMKDREVVPMIVMPCCRDAGGDDTLLQNHPFPQYYLNTSPLSYPKYALLLKDRGQ